MMETKVNGIPCQVRVDFFKHVKGDDRADNPFDFDGYYDIEFTLLDRRGYPALWLERKLTNADRDRIEQEIINDRR
jgi:hypothetical protein